MSDDGDGDAAVTIVTVTGTTTSLLCKQGDAEERVGEKDSVSQCVQFSFYQLTSEWTERHTGADEANMRLPVISSLVTFAFVSHQRDGHCLHMHAHCC